MGDERGLFAPASLEMYPFHRGLLFKSGAFGLFPELGSVPNEDIIAQDERSRHFGAKSLGIQLASKPARPSFLFFISNQPGATPQITPLSAPEAVQLLEQAKGVFPYAPRESRNYTRQEAVWALCNYARCYRLVSGDLDRTTALVESVLR